MRKKLSTGAKWEDIVGYSRAVRVGNTIEVSGTAAVEGGETVAPYDHYKQSIFILERIKVAIEGLGGTMEDVVRTRIYVTEISEWKAVGKAHGEYFKEIKPATSMIEISGLINEDMMVEIEATAIVDE